MVCIGRGLRHIDADTYYYNPTILAGTPSMIDYLRAVSGFNSELNTIIIGEASCPFRLFESLRGSNLKVYSIYGMTETSGYIGINELSDGSYTLFDANAVSIAEDGEILVGGPCVMKEYYNDSEATAAVLKDGVYHTGDYGRINSEGRLVLIRRNDDIILLPTGEKISRVRTNEQITAINGVAEGFITFYNNRLTAVIVPIDKSATEDIFKRRIDKYNEKKGYRWEIQKIVLRKEALPRKADGGVDEEAVCAFLDD
jgi:long-chain acyl-CoA synthetase